MVFKKLFARKSASKREWNLAPGRRIYAIGDIHGCADALEQILALIDKDNASRTTAETRLVFLGDLPDRGSDSKGVIERLMRLASERACHFLAGNHEELMIRVWEGERQSAPTFHRAGARATLISYGASAEDYDSWDFDQMTAATRRLVPEAHIRFLKGFDDKYQSGDYLFVHAGIRPGIPLEEQDPIDYRWIRNDFIHDQQDHGLMIIHGHTITKTIDERPNRIGIDTGAFQSGILSAIGLEGSERWFLDTANRGG